MKEQLEKIAEEGEERVRRGQRMQDQKTPLGTYEGLKALGYQVFMGPTSIKYWM